MTFYLYLSRSLENYRHQNACRCCCKNASRMLAFVKGRRCMQRSETLATTYTVVVLLVCDTHKKKTGFCDTHWNVLYETNIVFKHTHQLTFIVNLIFDIYENYWWAAIGKAIYWSFTYKRRDLWCIYLIIDSDKLRKKKIAQFI